jgi:hypothetical protein
MASYARIVKIKEDDITQQKPNGFYINKDEIEEFISKIPNILNIKKSKNTNISKTKLLNNYELSFLDINGEAIYNLYRELRENFSDHKLFQKIDYNGFLDIFLKNIKFDETTDDSDDEFNHENDE